VNGAVVFNGPVVNNGTITATNGTLTFANGYTGNGAYISDPSINNFTNLTIGAHGYLVGGAGDVWNISGNFTNNSLQPTLWNTSLSELVLSGTGVQQEVYLASANRGAVAGGYTHNFAWGELSLVSGESVQFLASSNNSSGGAALYVGLLQLGGGLSQLSSIDSAYDIYYNASLAGNAYLDDKTYALDGAGSLIPIASAVPLPASVWLMLSALGGMGLLARRHPGAAAPRQSRLS
jgi:hypothetical protein